MRIYVVIVVKTNRATYFRNKDNANKLASEIKSMFDETAIVLSGWASALECKEIDFDDEMVEKYL